MASSFHIIPAIKYPSLGPNDSYAKTVEYYFDDFRSVDPTSMPLLGKRFFSDLDAQRVVSIDIKHLFKLLKVVFSDQTTTSEDWNAGYFFLRPVVNACQGASCGTDRRCFMVTAKDPNMP